MANRTPSGFASLDELLGGGFAAGELVLVAGSTRLCRHSLLGPFLPADAGAKMLGRRPAVDIGAGLAWQLSAARRIAGAGFGNPVRAEALGVLRRQT